MSEISAIAAATSALNSAIQIARSALALRDESKLREAVIELQGVILTAQQSALTAQAAQLALLEVKGALEAKIAQFEAWAGEKQRYELAEIAPGVRAYHIKEGMRAGEPDHWICATCYQRGEKSILQTMPAPMRMKAEYCPSCKTKLEHY